MRNNLLRTDIVIKIVIIRSVVFDDVLFLVLKNEEEGKNQVELIMISAVIDAHILHYFVYII